MYNNPYMPYNNQPTLERINAQMAELEKMKEQLQKPIQPPTNLTQNFQIAPTNHDIIRYADNIDEVQRNMVVGDTPYFSKDMSVVWIKNAKGEVRTYELEEIVPKDAKDMQIELLQSQIDALREEIQRNDANVTDDDTKQNATDTSANDGTIGTAIEKIKPTRLSKVSTSQK